MSLAKYILPQDSYFFRTPTFICLVKLSFIYSLFDSLIGFDPFSFGGASHRCRGGHGFESRWSPDIFRVLLSNCLNWKIYCYDHSSLSSRFSDYWLTEISAALAINLLILTCSCFSIYSTTLSECSLRCLRLGSSSKILCWSWITHFVVMTLRGKSSWPLTSTVLVLLRYYCNTEFVDSLLLFINKVFPSKNILKKYGLGADNSTPQCLASENLGGTLFATTPWRYVQRWCAHFPLVM